MLPTCHRNETIGPGMSGMIMLLKIKVAMRVDECVQRRQLLQGFSFRASLRSAKGPRLRARALCLADQAPRVTVGAFLPRLLACLQSPWPALPIAPASAHRRHFRFSPAFVYEKTFANLLSKIKGPRHDANRDTAHLNGSR